MSRSSLLLFAVLAVWAFNAVACGARSQLDPGDEPTSSSGNPNGPGVGGSATGTGGAPAGTPTGDGGTGGQIILVGGGGGVPECVIFDSAAALAPLDVFIMLDSSGSMDFIAQGNTTKWQLVRNAFETFVNDPESAGLGVGLSFFPIINNSFNQLCAVNGGPGTNCLPGECAPSDICVPSFGALCDTNQDCSDAGFPGDTCDFWGFCNGNANGGWCNTPADCFQAGATCEPAGTCWSLYTCSSAPYQSPVFGVSKLPGAAGGFLSTFDSQTVIGGTPTLPALQGSVDGALSFANANPSHNVIVVLTTDGIPTVCDSDLLGNDPMAPIQNVANVAASAQAQDVGVFVIGVFAPDEVAEAQANLDVVAQAGAGQNAYIIETGNNQTTTDFVEALNEIRENAKSCEFELVEGEDPIDYSKVWVRIVDEGNEVWVKRVDGPGACDPLLGGFYYDGPFNPPNKPSRIILCPETCQLIDEAEENPTVEVFTSCPDPMAGEGGR